MAKDRQYREDSARLAALIEKYTNIPQDRVYHFVMENTAENLLPYANKLCKTEAQRQKLDALFEFKKLYEIVKGAENREYQLDSSNAAMDYFKNYFADVRDKEHFAVAYLDPQMRVIKTDTISDGTVAQAHVYPREIYKEALFINAAAVIISHNHPSGDLHASAQDIEITQRIKQGMELMGLQMYDHIVVGGDKAVSLVDNGQLTNRTFKDIGKAALPINENEKKPVKAAKPPSIKQQLAQAEKLLSGERDKTAPQKGNNDRGDR